MKHGGMITAACVLAALLPASQAFGQQAPLPSPPSLRLPAATPANTGVAGFRQPPRPVRAVQVPNSALPTPPQPRPLPRMPAQPALATGSMDIPANGSSTVPAATRTVGGEGLRLGSFVLTGEAETGGLYTTRRDDSGRDAVGLRSAPDLRLASNWPRHELAFTARGEFIAWNRGGGEASGEVAAALRLDARRDTRLRLSLADAMDRVDSGDATSGVQHEIDAAAALEYERYRLAATISTGVLRHVEPDAAQHYWQPHASLRLRLRTAPALAVYGEIGGDVRRFDRDGSNRDSRGGYVEGGVELLAGPIWEGRLGVRAAARDYRDPATANLYGVGINGELTWRPTRATTLQLESGFELQDETSARTRSQTLAVSWRQQLRRDVEMRSRLEVENDDAQDGDDSRILRASASLAWQIWRRLWITARYDMEKDITPGASHPPAEHRLGLGLRETF